MLFRCASDQLANRSGTTVSPASCIFGHRNRGHRQRTSSLQCRDGVCHQRDWRNFKGDRGHLQVLLKTINDVTEGAEQTANLAGTG